jgi:hypothetical protein
MRFEPAVAEYSVWVSAAATVMDYGGILVVLGFCVRRRFWEREADEKD